MTAIDTLKTRYPWPAKCPDVAPNPDGWFCGENRQVLQTLVADADIVLELGAWLGMSTRMLVDWCPGTVITIDHWKGSAEHQVNYPFLPILYETFVRNAWDGHRDRLIPMRTNTQEGMRELAELGITPDVIYVDASHETPLVVQDLTTAMQLFPAAHIVGDDWTWDSVKDAAYEVQPQTTRLLVPHTTCYEFLPEQDNAIT